MESNNQEGESVNLGVGEEVNFKLINKHLDEQDYFDEPGDEVILCFVDGDNMGALNEYLTHDPANKIFEGVYHSIHTIIPDPKEVALWYRPHARRDEFLCIFFFKATFEPHFKQQTIAA